VAQRVQVAVTIGGTESTNAGDLEVCQKESLLNVWIQGVEDRHGVNGIADYGNLMLLLKIFVEIDPKVTIYMGRGNTFSLDLLICSGSS
jgi:hypothetical protein